MTIETNNSSQFIDSALSRAVLFGLCGGMAAGLLDGWQARWFLEGLGSKAALLLQAVAWNALAGVLLAVFAGLFYRLGGKVAARMGRSPASGGELGIVLGTLPACIYLSVRLLGGGMTSRLPFKNGLIALTIIFLALATWILVRKARWLMDRLDRLPLNRTPLKIAIICAVVALTLGLRWCDAHLYRRLYLYLHGALAVLTLAGLSYAWALAIGPRRWQTLSRRAWIGGALGLVALVTAALLLFNHRQQVKFAAFERTATLANVLGVVYGSRGQKVKTDVDEAAKELRARRAAMLAQAAAGDWPIFPDAHVIIISVDALRADKLGVYGHTNRDLTPQIDAWAAKKAVVFERPYCAAPHSSYAITSLHTGRPARDEALLGKELDYPTLADLLGDMGYWTRAFYTNGIFHTEGEKVSRYEGTKFGFEKVTHGAPDADELTQKAKIVVDRIAAGDRPAFLWLHYFNVHEPYKSTHFGSSPVDRYDGEIKEMDDGVGDLLRHIDQTLGDNVVIVLTADHGEEFKDHGGYYHGSSLYDEQTRVPLIVKAPGGRPNRVSSQVSTLAIAPTLLGLVGAKVPGHMNGGDLRPAILSGPKSVIPAPVFSSVMHQKMVIDWPWKLIVDFGRGYSELFNLEADPKERVNRYDDNKKVGKRLLGELHAWLDELSRGDDQVQTALNLGRMRDPRAKGELLAVALNRGAPSTDRIQALALLAEFKGQDVNGALRGLLDDDDEQVAIHGALTLGEHGDASGRELMRDALYDDDPKVRDRAALALARLGDTVAVPHLVDALGRYDQATREMAVRFLGRLGDSEATEPLIDALEEERIRYLAVLALGKIGDPRGFDPLLRVLETDHHTDVRGYAVVGLGWMRDTKAVPRLLRILKDEPEIKWTPEALVRLGAVGRSPLFGTDLNQGAKSMLSGWGPCREKPRIVHGEFMGRTVCRTRGRRAALTFPVEANGESQVIIRARHLSSQKDLTAPMNVVVGSKRIGQMQLGAEFKEYRFEVEDAVWPARGEAEVQLDVTSAPAIELDHFLVFNAS